MSTNPRTYAGFVSGMFLFCCLIALSGCGREGFETAGQAATPLAPPNQQDCAPDPSNDGPECEGVTVDNCSEETSRCSTCIYQGAEEFCDGVDNNCNGRVDETLDALCADNLVCSRSAERCLDPTDRCTTDEHCVNQ
ncbi:MAG: hypothetical protein HOE75_11060, partial [Chloroflexi bacterium]|nr:hypothetical protein [Chloroflexota bacterium]